MHNEELQLIITLMEEWRGSSALAYDEFMSYFPNSSVTREDMELIWENELDLRREYAYYDRIEMRY